VQGISAIERFNNLTPDLLQQLPVQLPCVVVGFNQQDSTRDSAVIEEPRLHRYTSQDLKQPTSHSVASGSLHRNGVRELRYVVAGRDELIRKPKRIVRRRHLDVDVGDAP
jgi:hypothetical protein